MRNRESFPGPLQMSSSYLMKMTSTISLFEFPIWRSTKRSSRTYWKWRRPAKTSTSERTKET